MAGGEGGGVQGRQGGWRQHRVHWPTAGQLLVAVLERWVMAKGSGSSKYWISVGATRFLDLGGEMKVKVLFLLINTRLSFVHLFAFLFARHVRPTPGFKIF